MIDLKLSSANLILSLYDAVCLLIFFGANAAHVIFSPLAYLDNRRGQRVQIKLSLKKNKLIRLNKERRYKSVTLFSLNYCYLFPIKRDRL